MLLAAVSWPASRKRKALPMISVSLRGGCCFDDEVGVFWEEVEEVDGVMLAPRRRKPMRSMPSSLAWTWPLMMAFFLLLKISWRYLPHSM